MNTYNRNHVVIIAGDFNAKTGNGYSLYHENMGRFGKGIINNNGYSLLEFSHRNNMVLTNTLFNHKMAHRATWECPEKQQTNKIKNDKPKTNQIDYILIKNNDRKLAINSRSYSGIFTYTDHRLVILEMKIQNKYKMHVNRKTNITFKYNLI